MAPVGSRESLAAAIQAGADSVYFGIGKLNMRSHSANHFTIDDLREIAATCNEHGIKTYLTVNTVIYDNDIPTMKEIIDAAKEAGISAVIASDVAVMSYCNEVGEEVHLSTQLNISNTEALKFYARFADVSVLARELNMDQVKHIHEQIEQQNICGPMGKQIRIEMFCHGALCMAVSGKCYMSLANANRSANRGECVQICRRSYTVTDNETGNQLEIDNKYVMSPKDLKTIRFIDRMMDAGVRVFKIEGRARGPEYVYTVVKCYKEAIAAVLDGTFTEEGDDTLYDERIAIGSENELAIYIIALQPYAALTAVDKVLLVLVFLVERSQLVAQVNEHLILVHPVGEILELLYYFILQFINCCHYFISLISFTVINL